MQDSEIIFTFTIHDKSLWQHLINLKYVFFILICFHLGQKNNDHQLFNMAMICTTDIVIEVFDLAPNWKRRYLLTIVLIIRNCCADRGDIWNPIFFENVFSKEKFHTEIPSAIEMTLE